MRQLYIPRLFALESQSFSGTLTTFELGPPHFGKPAFKGRLIVQGVLNGRESTTED
jgi:hypothetical protein